MMFGGRKQPEKVVYKVLELPPDYKLPELTKELEASVAGLALHPGFKYLLAKLDLTKARLELELRASKHSTLIDVAYLQSGIQWAGWLRTQVSDARARLERARPLLPVEETLLPDYEIVGLDSPQG